jgi:hypothetical protein
MDDPPRIRLRDATIDDLELLEAWESPENRGFFNDFGLEPSGSLREPLSRGPLRNERNGTLIVERIDDGRPIGTVSWPSGSRPRNSSPPRTWIAWRPPRTSRTSPSSGRSRRPDSSARGSSAARSSVPGHGTTWSPIRGCAPTPDAYGPRWSGGTHWFAFSFRAASVAVSSIRLARVSGRLAWRTHSRMPRRVLLLKASQCVRAGG